MKINVERRTNSDRQNFFNGTFKESFNALVTATTGPDVVTLTITNGVSGNLTMQFSDGLTLLDVSGNGTIVLTEGTFNTPKTNWIYIPIDTKVLTKSETGYPTDIEYIPIAFVYLPNAAEIESDGAWINQNWNDHLMDNLSQGHLSHIGATIRLGTGYHSGIAPNGLDQLSNTSYFNVDGAAVRFKATSGISRQMHRHTHPAIDTGAGDDVHIINWNGDSFHSITDLKDIQADATGGSLSNKYFNVFWFEVANKTGEYAPGMAQLPNGSYVSKTSAENDVDGFDNNSMPREFILDSTVGVPICRMTMRWTGGFNTLIHISTTDLRTGGIAAGGGAIGGGTSFADNQFNIFDEADITKVVNFDVSTVATNTTRILSIPNLNGEIALMGTTQSTNFITTGTGRFDGGLTDSSGQVVIETDIVGQLAGPADTNYDGEVMLDFGEGVAHDSGGDLSYDFDSRIAYGSSDKKSIHLQERKLFDTAEALRYNWDDGKIYVNTSGANTLSIDTNFRQLYATDGTSAIFDWKVAGKADFLNNLIETGGDIRIDTDSGLYRSGNIPTDYTFGWNGSNAVHTIIAGGFNFVGGDVNVDENLTVTSLGTLGATDTLQIQPFAENDETQSVSFFEEVGDGVRPKLFIYGKTDAGLSRWISFGFENNQRLEVIGSHANVEMLFKVPLSIQENVPILFGNRGYIRYNGQQTHDGMEIYHDAASTRSANTIFTSKLGGGKPATFNRELPENKNSHIYLFSEGESTDEWLSLSHDGTDGIIATGKGDLNLNPFGDVNILNNLIVGTLGSPTSFTLLTSGGGNRLNLITDDSLGVFSTIKNSDGEWGFGMNSVEDFIIRDIESGGIDVMRISKGAPTESIYIDSAGDVGFGRFPQSAYRIQIVTPGTLANLFLMEKDGDILLPNDNQKISFGETSTDLELFSDGTNGQIDTSSDLFLNATGNVKFGTNTSISGETVTSYITIKDSGGTTRKLAVVS